MNRAALLSDHSDQAMLFDQPDEAGVVAFLFEPWFWVTNAALSSSIIPSSSSRSNGLATTSTRRSYLRMCRLQRGDSFRSRQPDSERGAVILAAARRPDPATVALHQRPTDVEPQAHAWQAPPSCVGGTPKRLEDRLKVLA